MTIPDPTKFKNPCNCFGLLGQFEGAMDFHEMGIDGCRNYPVELTRRSSPFEITAYNNAVDDCAAIICGGCARKDPIQFARHQTFPVVAGGSFPCVATRLLELKKT